MRTFRQVLGACLGSGILAGCLLAFALTLFGNRSGTLVAFALGLPIVSLQDGYRALAFFKLDSLRALLLDITWLVVQGTISALLALVGQLTAADATCAWILGGLASAVLGSAWEKCLPWRGGFTWIRTNFRRGSAVAVEFLSGQGSLQLGLLLTGLVLGPVGLSAFRIAQLVFGPVNLLAQGTYGWAMPRLVVRTSSERRSFGLRIGIPFALICLFGGFALLIAPLSLMRSVFGDPWQGVTAGLLVAVTLDRAIALITQPLSWAARAQGRTKILAWTRIMTGTLAVLASTALAASLGPTGAAIGFLLAGVPFLVVAYRNSAIGDR